MARYRKRSEAQVPEPEAANDVAVPDAPQSQTALKFCDSCHRRPCQCSRGDNTAAAIARSIADAPVLPRMSTTIPGLDSLTRGGPPLGRKVVVAGPPGANKTMLVCQWAHHWVQQGAASVVVLACDQDCEDVLVRLGLRCGLDRDTLDGGKGKAARRAAWNKLAGYLDPLRLVVLDGESTLEGAIMRVMSMPEPRVLVVDSLQTARSARKDVVEAASPRGRIDALLTGLRLVASRGVLVVATSEMARGGYRSSDPSQQTDALAAAKESGAIEYLADVLLALRTPKAAGDVVDVQVAKNRLGPRGQLRLALDRERATLTEIPTKAEDAAALDDRKWLALLDDVCGFVSYNPGCSTGMVDGEVKARREKIIAALNRLLKSGRIENRGTETRPKWFAIEGEEKIAHEG